MNAGWGLAVEPAPQEPHKSVRFVGPVRVLGTEIPELQVAGNRPRTG